MSFLTYFLALIVFSLPAYQIRFHIFGLPTTLLEILLIILFIGWTAYKINKEELCATWLSLKNKLGVSFYLILAWLIISLISCFWAPNFTASLGIWRAYFLEPIILFFIFLDLIKDSQQRKLILKILFLSALVIALYALAQKFFHFGGVWSLEVAGQPKVWRATSVFAQPNFLGMYLAPIILLALGSSQKIKFKNIFLWLVILGGIISVFLAKSDGALLGIIIGVVAYFVLLNAKARKNFIICALFGVLILLSVSPTRDIAWRKISFQDLSEKLRINIWQSAFILLKQNPFLGAGINGYQQLIKDYQKPVILFAPDGQKIISVETHPYPHNLYLAIWLETGIIGLILFVAIIFFFFKKLRQNLLADKLNREVSLAIAAAMVAILIHGLVDTPYFKNDLAILFWMLVALIF